MSGVASSRGAGMVFGFCSACMNRRWQLEQTLPSNLAALRGTRHFIALVDYNSQDDLGALARRFSAEIADGRLTYFATTEPRHFHMSVAKNTAHRLALQRRPDVLFNLDADNHLAPRTLARMEEVFARSPDAVFHSWSSDWMDGSFGRIAIASRNWLTTGGYDESFEPMGWQSTDFLLRCRALGFSYERHDDGLTRPVPNTIADKLAHLAVERGARGADDALATFGALSQKNIVQSLSRPIRLSLEDQRRFRGWLDFQREVTI